MNLALLVPRCVQCVAWSASLACAVFTGSAWAQSGNALGQVSTEFWLGVVFTVLSSLIALQARNLTERVKAVEHQGRDNAASLSLFMQTLPDKFYTKAEARELQTIRDLHTAEHRERMEASLRDLNSTIASLAGRIDHMARPQHRREDDAR